MVRILRPIWYVVAGDGPGVDGVGDTERARLGGCTMDITVADRSGRLDGPAIGTSGPGRGGFDWGGLSLCCWGTYKSKSGMFKRGAHLCGLSTSLELELVSLCYYSL